MVKYFKEACLALTLSLVLAALAWSLVSAQGSGPGSITDNQVNAIARQLYCPVCENIPLDVCGTQACAQWRELIRDKLSQGWTETQIKQYFVDQYGVRVLGVPPAQGLNWLVYILPPVAIVVGIFIIFTALRAWRRNAPMPVRPDSSPPPADEYVARLEEELNKR